MLNFLLSFNQVPIDTEGFKGLLTLEGITAAGLLVCVCVYMGWQLRIERKEKKIVELARQKSEEDRIQDMKDYNLKFEAVAKEQFNFLSQMKELFLNVNNTIK